VQAQPPAALRSVSVAAEELDEKRRKFCNRASECGRKKRAKYGILLHMSIECCRERTAPGGAADGTIELDGLGQESIVALKLIMDYAAIWPLGPATSTYANNKSLNSGFSRWRETGSPSGTRCPVS